MGCTRVKDYLFAASVRQALVFAHGLHPGEGLPVRCVGATGVGVRAWAAQREESHRGVVERSVRVLMPDVVWEWNEKQTQVLLSDEPFIDMEGGTGAGKTTPLLAKALDAVTSRPGIHVLLCRWSQDSLDRQLRPAWEDFAGATGLEMEWNNDESYFEVRHTEGGPSGHCSRVYMMGLRTSDSGIAKYQKIRGLNLSLILVDQGEEIPYPYFVELVARLRQVGYPNKQFILACQPVPKHHWLDREFPENNSKKGRLYVRTNAYDNRKVLTEEYILLLEATYPEGSSERRTLLEGRRGLTSQGEAVYGGYFKRKRHEQMVEMNPELPLYQALDFGHHHPCLSFFQFETVGRLVILGAVMGRSMFLEDFIPAALQILHVEQEVTGDDTTALDCVLACDAERTRLLAEEQQLLQSDAANSAAQARLREVYDRLTTIATNTDLGSGMQVALKDLEIRGAGNLLGGEQSGHIAEVGFDLYMRMVGEAVEDFKTGYVDANPRVKECKVELPITAHLPVEYVPSERLRLDLYRRMADAQDDAGLDGIVEELVDRFGELPIEAVNLVDVARLRVLAKSKNYSEVVLQGKFLKIAPITLPESAQLRLQRQYPGSLIKSVTQSILVARGSEVNWLGGADIGDTSLLPWAMGVLASL
jgi:PBSX family phage terminase large subunit